MLFNRHFNSKKLSFGKRAPCTVNINSILHQQISYSASLNVYRYMREIINHYPSVVPRKLGENTAWDCMGFCFKKGTQWGKLYLKMQGFPTTIWTGESPYEKIKVNNLKPYCSFSASITLKQTYFMIKRRYTTLNFGGFQAYANMTEYSYITFWKSSRVLKSMQVAPVFTLLWLFSKPKCICFYHYAHMYVFKWFWTFHQARMMMIVYILTQIMVWQKYGVDVTGWYFFRGFQA